VKNETKHKKTKNERKKKWKHKTLLTILGASSMIIAFVGTLRPLTSYTSPTAFTSTKTICALIAFAMAVTLHWAPFQVALWTSV
jgi:hypothetical protein